MIDHHLIIVLLGHSFDQWISIHANIGDYSSSFVGAQCQSEWQSSYRYACFDALGCAINAHQTVIGLIKYQQLIFSSTVEQIRCKAVFEINIAHFSIQQIGIDNFKTNDVISNDGSIVSPTQVYYPAVLVKRSAQQ